MHARASRRRPGRACTGQRLEAHGALCLGDRRPTHGQGQEAFGSHIFSNHGQTYRFHIRKAKRLKYNVVDTNIKNATISCLF
jgi:hypothetical protein